MNKMLSNKKTIAIFILPAILIFTLIIPVPLIMSVGLSFFDWDLLSKAKFVGINYDDITVIHSKFNGNAPLIGSIAFIADKIFSLSLSLFK